MGKRSNFVREGRDYYRTWDDRYVRRAADILFGDSHAFYIEPCAGAGDLIDNLDRNTGLVCCYAGDLLPQTTKSVAGVDIVSMNASDMFVMEKLYRERSDTIITNPPWKWAILEPMLALWLDLGFTCWLLLSSDFASNVQSSRFMKRCSDIVPVGRGKWIPDSKDDATDNASWYCFRPEPCKTIHHPRDRS